MRMDHTRQPREPGCRITVLLLLLATLLLSSLGLGGCGEAPAPPGADRSSGASPTARQVDVPQPTAIRFTDVTAQAGIDFHHEAGASGKKWYPETIGAGGGFFDYDGDGLVDILLVNGRRWPGERHTPEPTMRLYRNQGDGTFVEMTQAAGLDVPLYGMGFAAADFDNDGDQDLLVTGYLTQLFFINNGNGTFTDMTHQVGLQQGQWGTAATFVDYDRDGWLDLIIGHYVHWDPSQEAGLDCTYGTPTKDYCAVKYFAGQGLTLYRNLGDGRFADVTAQAGMQAPGARVLGLAVIDYNQDGWPDVVVANDLTPTLLFANNSDGTFKEIGVDAGVVVDEGGVAFAGMGIDAAYIKNDTQLCVAIGNFTGQPSTLHCQAQVGTAYRPDMFIEESPRAGLARPTLRMVTFGLFFFDADLDGWQDLFMVNGHVVNEERLRNVPYAQPPQLFRNRGDGTFTEVRPPPGTGLDRRMIGRGAAYADYDHDGDLDLLLTTNQGPAYLLRNDTPRPNHYLRVRTQGTRSNRDGIGATVRLYTTRQQRTAMVRTGSSYLSQSELPLTFGLEPAEQVDRLEILWPSGMVDVYRQLQPDTTVLAREGASQGEMPMAQQPGAVPAVAGEKVSPQYLPSKRAAIAHYEAGHVDAAIAAFEEVLQLQPSDYMTQQYLIELLWRRGARERARTLLNDMARALPEANFLSQFAMHLEEVKVYDLADEVYREAARADPQAPEAPYRLGNRALQSGRYENAASYFRDALARQPHMRDALHGLGLVYAAQGKTDQAEAQFQAALRQDPDFPEAYTHLAKIYTRTGRLDEAIAAYGTVIKLEPARAQGYHNLGAVLAAKGSVDEAMVQFEAALRRDPHYSPARNDLGTLYAERGEIVKAIAAFSAVIQHDPTWVQAHYNLAMAYRVQGDVPAMMRELQETVRLDAQHVDAHLHLGVVYLQQGQAEMAVEQFRTVVRLDPNHAMAHSALASLYFQGQQYETAWRHAQKAAALGAPVQSLIEALRQVRGPAK